MTDDDDDNESGLQIWIIFLIICTIALIGLIILLILFLIRINTTYNTNNEIIRPWDKINRVYYINLEYRKDRNAHIIEEFKRMSIPNDKIHRINAIKHERGYIGCGKSHILALKDAIDNNYEHVIIFEDDFQFVVSSEYLNKVLIHLFKTDTSYNICLLGYNMIKCTEYDEHLIKVINAQTASGYLISKRYIPILLQCFEEAVLHLENSKPYEVYAIDQHWKKLQGENKKWYAFKQRIGIQMESYSDILGFNVNYKC